ncbi:hypothetical protein ES708_07498 [subsurface metagenome]
MGPIFSSGFKIPVDVSLKVINTTGYFFLLNAVLTNSGEIPLPQSTDTTSDFLPFNFAIEAHLSPKAPQVKNRPVSSSFNKFLTHASKIPVPEFAKIKTSFFVLNNFCKFVRILLCISR